MSHTNVLSPGRCEKLFDGVCLLETIHNIFHNITLWYIYLNKKNEFCVKKDALTEKVLVMTKIEINTNSCQQQRKALVVTWSPSFSNSRFPKDSPGFALPNMGQQLLFPVIAN